MLVILRAPYRTTHGAAAMRIIFNVLDRRAPRPRRCRTPVDRLPTSIAVAIHGHASTGVIA